MNPTPEQISAHFESLMTEIRARMDELSAKLARVEAALAKTPAEPPKPDARGFYTTQQVCRIFNIDRATLGEWRRRKKITWSKPGGRVLFTEQDVQSAISKHTHHARTV